MSLSSGFDSPHAHTGAVPRTGKGSVPWLGDQHGTRCGFESRPPHVPA